MFQTGIHIALQSPASGFLTRLMLLVTALGYYQVIIMILIAVLFGFSLRKGFLLFQVIFWTAVLSEMAKDFFGLPRPFFADNRVAALEPGWDTTGAFRAMGGRGFLDLPARPVIDAFRLKGMSFGFPSGHTSSAMAVWGGLAVVFRRKALAWLAPLMVTVIAFSRVYLGVHFLGDIIGGAALGGLVLFGAWRLWRSEGRREEPFAAMHGAIARSLPAVLYLLVLFVLPLLLVLFSLASSMYAGFYFGLNAAFALALRSGLPADRAAPAARLLRALLAALLFLLLGLSLHQAIALLPALAVSRWGGFMVAALDAFLTVWIGLKLLLRLGLYRRDEGAAPALS
jgi:membrane-associated phospholipid phosphatase